MSINSKLKPLVNELINNDNDYNTSRLLTVDKTNRRMDKNPRKAKRKTLRENCGIFYIILYPTQISKATQARGLLNQVVVSTYNR